MTGKRIFPGKTRIFFVQSCRLLLFFALMALVFHLTFHVVGKALGDLLTQAIDAAALLAAATLREAGTSAGLSSLILEGIFPGVGSVLSFVPVIGTLFFFLSLMQESGYLSHVAALMDAPMRCIGLSGQAVIPMMMGFGCNVPAIISAGSMLTGRERLTVVMMIPFLSCSARLPIYGLFISAFFPAHSTVMLAAVYAMGVLAALLLALTLKKAVPPAGPCSVHCATPRNVFKSVFRAVFQNCLGFIKKAFTVILLASIIVWFLQHFDPSMQPTSNPEDSLLASLGRAAAPIFAPLGFGDWRAVSALISGFFAKEAVISTLAVIAGAAPDAAVTVIMGADPGLATAANVMAASAPALSSMLSVLFTPLSAFSFMTFCLLYTPCIATFAAAKQILGIKRAVLLAVLQIVMAWMVSFLLFQTGSLIMQL